MVPTLACFSFGLGGRRDLYDVQKSAIFMVDTSSAVSSFCRTGSTSSQQHRQQTSGRLEAKKHSGKGVGGEPSFCHRTNTAL